MIAILVVESTTPAIRVAYDCHFGGGVNKTKTTIRVDYEANTRVFRSFWMLRGEMRPVVKVGHEPLLIINPD